MFSSNRGEWRPNKEVSHSGATGFPGEGYKQGDQGSQSDPIYAKFRHRGAEWPPLHVK